MEKGILDLHSFMRWVVLLFLVLTLVSSFTGMMSRKDFAPKDRRLALFLMVSADLQLLLGLMLYFLNGWFYRLTSESGIMSNNILRFWTVEHVSGMLIGLIFIHIGYASTKKKVEDPVKFKRLFLFTLLALIVILITIPWPFRADVGRPWLPGL
jgi:hypothetical protein